MPSPKKDKTSQIGGIGRNRFLSRQRHHQYQTKSQSTNGQQQPTLNSNDGGGDYEVLDRTFDFYIGPSKFSSLSQQSLINNYAPHCKRSLLSPMSLIWQGMVDEIRVVPLIPSTSNNTTSVGDDDDESEREMLLLGMGYFTWSGGFRNSAPFCLVAKNGHILQK